MHVAKVIYNEATGKKIGGWKSNDEWNLILGWKKSKKWCREGLQK
jgi:hypothetical protein